jgi:hypothetical protein
MAEWRIREDGAMIFDLGQEDMNDPRASQTRRGGAHIFVRFYAKVEPLERGESQQPDTGRVAKVTYTGHLRRLLSLRRKRSHRRCSAENAEKIPTVHVCLRGFSQRGHSAGFVVGGEAPP